MPPFAESAFIAPVVWGDMALLWWGGPCTIRYTAITDAFGAPAYEFADNGRLTKGRSSGARSDVTRSVWA